MLSLFRTVIALTVLLTNVGIASQISRAQDANGETEFASLESRYARIITDLPLSDENRQWGPAIDAAVVEACQFWQVPLERLDGWRVTMHVMSDKSIFAQAGLIPATLPDFPHGFQLGNRAWVVQQSSAYYTRHLILHELMHALASEGFGGGGPPWFMEGSAEYLATHHWDGSHLQLAVIPTDKTEVPYWGRIKMIEDRRSAGKALSLVSVLRYSDTAHRQVEPYAWTWAAISLFASYPDTQQTLVDAARGGADGSPQFTRQFVSALGPRWPLAQARWRVLIDELDYGYDLTRGRLDVTGEEPLWDGATRTVKVRADRGWQSSGMRIRQGTRVKIAATGWVTLANEPKPWRSPPDGVTIRYHRGAPLGKLMVAVLPEKESLDATIAPVRWEPIGAAGLWNAAEEGWLLLRVNDLPSELADNTGAFEVTLEAP